METLTTQKGRKIDQAKKEEKEKTDGWCVHHFKGSSTFLIIIRIRIFRKEII